jgi:hypothetical protein
MQVYKSIPLADMKCNSELVGLADPAEIATVFGWMKHDFSNHTRFTYGESRSWGRNVRDKIGFKSGQKYSRTSMCRISYAQFETLRDDGVFTTYSNGMCSDLAITISTAVKYNLAVIDDFICTFNTTVHLDMIMAMMMYDDGIDPELMRGYEPENLCGLGLWGWYVGIHIIPDVVVKSAGKE